MVQICTSFSLSGIQVLKEDQQGYTSISLLSSLFALFSGKVSPLEKKWSQQALVLQDLWIQKSQ